MDFIVKLYKIIILFQQNERVEEYKTEMSENSTNILKDWLWADYKLYSTFNDILTEKLKKYGHNRLIKDLKQLRELNAKLKKDCKVRKMDNTELIGTDFHMSSPMVKGYYVTEKCRLYATSEPSFFNIIRNNQERGKPNPGFVNTRNNLKFKNFFIFAI